MKLCPSCASVSPDTVLSCPCCPCRFLLQVAPGDASFISRRPRGDAARGPCNTASLQWPTWPSDGLFRDGDTLVMLKSATLPDRCVKCNAPSTRRLALRFAWHPPEFWLLLFIGLPLYIFLAWRDSKRAVLSVGLCKEHAQRATSAQALTMVATAVGVALLLLAFFTLEGLPALAGMALLLGAHLGRRFAAQVVRAPKIGDDLVWLRGAAPAFLAELPPVR